MRFKGCHFVRLLLKSVVVFSIIFYVTLLLFHSTPSYEQIVEQKVHIYRVNIVDQTTEEFPAFDYVDVNNIGQDLSSDKIGGGWSDFEKNEKYHLRFWDLVKSVNSSHDITTEPLFSNELDNLWRPLKDVRHLDGRESNRLVQQTVWQMEALNSSYASSFKPKTIVFWDSFKWWNHADWGKGPKQLLQSDCEMAHSSLTQCTFIEDQHHEFDLSKADAVISQIGRTYKHGEFPEHLLKFSFMLESPISSSWGQLKDDHDLLATYWRGSDIVTPYGKWVYYDLNKTSKANDKDYTVGKSKRVAAFISNCQKGNDRLGFIRELKNYINVDLYGHCGDFKCSRKDYKDCFEMIKKDYFFYLAFENSNCRDYITEKLYLNALTNDVVPIVMGAHPEDYKAMAPLNSYIHIEDFKGPKELADYLTHLLGDPSEYNKYFSWKRTGEFISSSFFCQLCAMVHYADIVPPPKRTEAFRCSKSESVETGMCLAKGQWYWTKHNDGSPKKY